VAGVCLGAGLLLSGGAEAAAVPERAGAEVQKSGGAEVQESREVEEMVTRVITYILRCAQDRLYDPLQRLTAAVYSTGERYEYAYDAVGNRTVMTVAHESRITHYEYDAANRLLVSASPGHRVTYGWDARGNLTNDGVFTYTYDAAGKMVRVWASGPLAPTATLAYTYTSASLSAGTADGLRVAQAANGAETTFAWDWAAPVPELLRAGGTRYLVGHETLGWWDGATWAYYLPDALGSLRQAADAAGAVVRVREWTPYGEEVGSALSGPGYTGEWYDAVVGLVYLRARWYAPGVGRFTQRDPWEGDPEHPQSLDRYVYVENNPVMWVDPSGLTRLMVVRGANAHHPEGLAVRTAPSRHAKLLSRIRDGTQVITVQDSPVPGTDGGLWYSLLWIGRERVWPGFGVPSWYWVSSRYLVDVVGPSTPPVPNPSPAPGGTLQFTASPVAGVTAVGGFGATQFAYNKCGTTPCDPQAPVSDCKYRETRGLHNGLDLIVPNGTPVYWTGNVNGIVKYLGDEYRDARPNVVVEAAGYNVVFGHLSREFTVEKGQEVSFMTQIGTTGNENHLHLGIVMGAKFYNPLYFFGQSVADSFVALMGRYIEGEGPWSMRSYTRSSGICANYFWGCPPDRTGIDR
jgi:RHS repeat-associated protein